MTRSFKNYIRSMLCPPLTMTETIIALDSTIKLLQATKQIIESGKSQTQTINGRILRRLLDSTLALCNEIYKV